MDAIIVDDGPFAQALSNHFNIKHRCMGFDKDPREVAMDIVDLRGKIGTDSEKVPILINIEAHCSANSKRQEQKGVEVLLWLRCKHKVVNPIVLYSFQPNHLLLKRKPEHLVINSEGCYYVQLPEDFGLLSLELRGVTDLESLRKYLRPAFSIEQFRHKEANWWGVVQLVDVHRSLYPHEIRFQNAKGSPIQYPQRVQEALDSVENMKAVFLYGHEGFVEALELIKREEMEKELRSIVHQISHIEKDLTLTGKKNPKSVADFISYYEQLIADNQNNQAWDANTRPTIEGLLQDAKQKQAEHVKNKAQLTKRKADLESQRGSSRRIDASGFAGEILKLRKMCGGLKILYIDDQAKEGWEDILKLILDTTTRGRFESIEIRQPSRVTDNIKGAVEEVFREVETKIHGFNPDVILVDVRLMPDYDRRLSHDVQHLSGALLLREIRSAWPGFPVVVTTASNKVWTFAELMKLGADGYWIKEGLDAASTAQESVENYIRFLRLVKSVTGSEYRFVKSYAEKVERLRTKNDHWWHRQVTWKNRDKTSVPSDQWEEPLRILAHILIRLRSYCYQYVMSYGQQVYEESSTVRSGYLKGIINDLGSIVELIHGEDTATATIGGINEPYRSSVIYRGDFLGMFVKMMRNKASHYAGSKAVTFEQVMLALSVTLDWLGMTDPLKQHVPNNTSQSQSWQEFEAQILKVMNG